MVMRNIFEGVSFIDDITTPISTPSMNAVYAEGVLIKNCNFAITESVLWEYANNVDAVVKYAILEGAKLDMMFNNFLEEGTDYKGLKADMKEIIEANNMEDAQLQSKGKKILNTCKKALQKCIDIIGMVGYIGTSSAVGGAVGGGVSGAALGVGALNPITIAFVRTAIPFIVMWIGSRLLRLIVDAAEFAAAKKEAEGIVAALRKSANEAKDKKTANKLNDEADKLEASIKKYSNKKKKENK